MMLGKRLGLMLWAEVEVKDADWKCFDFCDFGQNYSDSESISWNFSKIFSVSEWDTFFIEAGSVSL